MSGALLESESRKKSSSALRDGATQLLVWWRGYSQQSRGLWYGV